MTASKIFINYRRVDSAPYAGRLCENLRSQFVEHEVFMDLRIPLGDDFVQHVEREIDSCAVLLVLIGPRWLDVTDEGGRHRLSDPDDLVRIEITMALQRGVLVIPLLVGGAQMPRASDLPESLTPLVRRTNHELRDGRWDDDVAWLAKTLTRRLEDLAPTTDAATSVPPPITRKKPVVAPVPRRSAGPSTEQSTQRRRRRVAALAGAAVLAVAASAFAVIAAGGGSSPTVKVGAFYPVSGVDAVANNEVLDGVRLAVDYVNHATETSGSTLPLAEGAGLPGLGGARLELVLPKEQPTRCNAGAVVDRFVTHDHVAAVIGAYESTLTLRGIVAADRDQIPLVNGGSSVTSLTRATARRRIRTCGTTTVPDPRPSPWFFRVGPDDDQAARQFFALLERDAARHIHKIALLHESRDIFGNSAAADTKRIARTLGITFPRHDFVYPSALGTSASSPCALQDAVEKAVTALKQYKPDAVFAVSYPPDAIAVTRAMQKHGVVPYAMLAYGSGFLGDTFIHGVGNPGTVCGLPAADPGGIISHAAWSPDVEHQTATARRIATLFQQHYGRPMTSRSAVGFTAMMTLAQAINNAGSRDPSKIQAALRRIDVPANATIMPWAGVRFGASGQNTRADVVLQQIIGGRYRVVYPSNKATDPAILPLAKTRK